MWYICECCAKGSIFGELKIERIFHINTIENSINGPELFLFDRFNIRICIVYLIIGLGCWSSLASAKKHTYKAALPHVPGLMYRNADGTPGGFAAELLVQVSTDEQFELEWIDGNWNDLYEKTINGQIDILINTQVTQARKQHLDFLSQHLYVMWSELYVAKETDFRSIMQLDGKRIALVKGDNNSAGFREYIMQFYIHWKQVEFSSHQNALAALRQGKVFAMIGPTPEMLGDGFDGIKRSGLVFNPSKLSISFPKGKNRQLQQMVDGRIQKYRTEPDAILYNLMKKHKLGDVVSHQERIPRWLWPAFGGLVIMIILSWAFVALLRAQVQRKTQELRSTSKKLEQAARIAGMGYWDFDHGANEIVVSTYLCQLLEIPSSQPIRTNESAFIQYIYSDDKQQAADLFAQSITNKQIYSFAHRIISAKGQMLWIQSIGYHEFNGDGSPRSSFGIFLDITQRVRAQEALEQKNNQLQHAQRMESVGNLAGGIAHDFNNMLSGIIGYAEIIENETDTTLIVQYVKKILDASDKAAALTSQLLAFARKEKLQANNICVHEVVESAIGLLNRTVTKSISIEKRLSAPKSMVFGDSALLTNALLNLAINSRDAMPNGGILRILTQNYTCKQEEQLTNTASVLHPGEYVIICVEDNGQGIEKTDIQRVFEPFFTTKPQGKGTGLGLAAVYGTVASHEGAIDIQAQKNKGTTVRVFLPLLGEHSAEPMPTIQTTPKNDAKLKILLVEDEQMLREMAELMLQSLGHDVTVAQNGEDGFKEYQSTNQRFDIVITDIQMPKMGGAQLCALIYKQNPNQKVIVVSGVINDMQLDSVTSNKNTFFIKKPYRKRELRDAITSMQQDKRSSSK